MEATCGAERLIGARSFPPARPHGRSLHEGLAAHAVFRCGGVYVRIGGGLPAHAGLSHFKVHAIAPAGLAGGVRAFQSFRRGALFSGRLPRARRNSYGMAGRAGPARSLSERVRAFRAHSQLEHIEERRPRTCAFPGRTVDSIETAKRTRMRPALPPCRPSLFLCAESTRTAFPGLQQGAHGDTLPQGLFTLC